MITKTRIATALFMSFFIPFVAQAQTVAELNAADREVRNVVMRVFDGMREADSAKIRSAFAPGVRFASAKEYESPDAWLGAVAKSNKRWDERSYNTEVKLNGDVASVWSEYNFYLDGKLRHCGVNSIELLRFGTEWKVTQWSDTQVRTGCASESENDRAAILATVQKFFDGMKARDTLAMNASALPNAVIANPIRRGDSLSVRILEPGPWKAAVMKTAEPYDERMTIPEAVVNIHKDVATVWGRYVFRVGSRITNCGINAFTLLRTRDGWKVSHVASTIETTGCED